MNNKELINAGHALAKAISNDTPLIEIAKMVSNLATQLDVQIVRADQLALALYPAEKRNAELTEFLTHIKKCLVRNGEYAPLSHEEIDTLLGIRANGTGIGE